ncbi:MAG: hypothetical protein ACR2HV_03335 [Acidimicrobiales bacterium]
MPEPTGAVVRVTRDKSRSPDRTRPYAVVVDEALAGEVRRGQTTEVPVAPGEHVVRVSIDFEHSREWTVSLAEGDAVRFVCRSRGKTPSEDHIDVFLADPSDRRARVRQAADATAEDMAVKHRAVTRDGQVLSVWAHRSGYLRSLDVGSSSDGDAFILELALYILVLPVLGVLRWVRHRWMFKRGWSVGAVRKRRFLWPKKVYLERLPDEARARVRAGEVLAEVEDWPRPA